MPTQHLVPVGAIVKDNKILLGFKHNSSAEHCQNKWEVLGGKTKFGEKYEEALKNKMKQYLGVEIKVGKILPIVYSVVTKLRENGEEVQYYVVPAKCSLQSENFKLDTNKIREVKWFTLSEVQELHKKEQLVDSGDLEIAKMALGL
jgi:ADP-ribose pyrophosphatase YjhB (NUDIX family)